MMPTSDWPPTPLPVPSPAAASDFTLRPWTTHDVTALAAAWGDDEIRAWLTPPPPSIPSAAAWIDGWEARREAGLALDLVIEAGGRVAGEIGMSSFDCAHRAALVGYWVTSDCRGRGLASDALGVVGRWFLQDLGGQALLAQCHPANAASHRTAEAAGFRLLGTHDGLVVYSLRQPVDPSRPARDL